MKKRKENGFTIIEMIVVMAIIAIISAVVLTGYPSARKQLLIQRVASGLTQDIRRVQSMSVSSKMLVGPDGCKMFPAGGYGISFDLSNPTKITIFADCEVDGKLTNGNNRCDPGGSCSKFGEKIEEITLERDAQIYLLSPSVPNFAITFLPPNPIVSIPSSASEATIGINLISDAAKVKTVKVNKAGLIWIQ
jgi:prepilin-type N-terminal cleavage/methylation domain-containing protein